MPASVPGEDVRLHDIVRLRKAHPCGGDRWEIARVGADIGLVCLVCRRRVLLPRHAFVRRLRAVLDRAADPVVDPPDASAGVEPTRQAAPTAKG